ncbi:heterokaryon incompatibility protein-domain-containing protein [Lophiotrema nucula]|uniref:Heterokaryon incompatibility protein-domain-containing protein n=1 Tax=Lophiotrema nucula TaxID=690887 RepID=A0A6A5ZB49_9PLEO|nr:heterokaryon incompatibility protein-domain-containing protein [Lophiotrema nucula]
MVFFHKVWSRSNGPPANIPPLEADEYLDSRDIHLNMEYHALDQSAGDIRLLEILQPHAVTDTSIAGTLIKDNNNLDMSVSHYPLSEVKCDETLAKRYIALSYIWGDANDPDQVFIDGIAVVVRSNLKRALSALQDTLLVQQGCRIWTDALCINQNDTAELSHEVGRMGTIYKQAYRVVVWLGDATDDSDLAMDFINSVTEAWEQGEESARKCIRDTLATYGTIIWQACEAIVTRKYFDRMWIIQELSMGGDTAIILCGHKETTWANLFRFYDTSYDSKPEYRTPKLAAIFREEIACSSPAAKTAYVSKKGWNWLKCENFQIIQDATNEPGLRDDRHLLTRCEMAACINPRDKVYGMLSLVDPAVAAKIVPDYSTSATEVYTAFAKAYIEGKGDLFLLIHSGKNWKDDEDPEFIPLDKPSWVPDLRKRTMSWYNLAYGEPSVDAGIPPKFEFLSSNKILKVRGLFIGHIDGLCGRNRREDNLSQLQDITPTKHISNAYGSDEAFKEALWRAIMMDKDQRGHRAPSEFSCILDSAIFSDKYAPPNNLPVEETRNQSILWNYHMWLRRNASLVLGGEPFKDWFSELGVLESKLDEYCDILSDFGPWTRRFGITDNGYLGIFPPEARQGDVVAVVFGCGHPLLLKPMGDRFQIVSECYVQGLMRGEVGGLLRRGEFRERDVEIC